MERTTFEPFTKQKNDVNEYSSPAFEQLRNMMLPDTDVYKPKKKELKTSNEKKSFTNFGYNV